MYFNETIESITISSHRIVACAVDNYGFISYIARITMDDSLIQDIILRYLGSLKLPTTSIDKEEMFKQLNVTRQIPYEHLRRNYDILVDHGMIAFDESKKIHLSHEGLTYLLNEPSQVIKETKINNARKKILMVELSDDKLKFAILMKLHENLYKKNEIGDLIRSFQGVDASRITHLLMFMQDEGLVEIKQEAVYGKGGENTIPAFPQEITIVRLTSDGRKYLENVKSTNIQKNILSVLDVMYPDPCSFYELSMTLSDLDDEEIWRELVYLKELGNAKFLISDTDVRVDKNLASIKLTASGRNYLQGKETTTVKHVEQEIHANQVGNIMQAEKIEITNIKVESIYNQILREIEKIGDGEKKSFWKKLADQAKDNAPLLQIILEGIRMFASG